MTRPFFSIIIPTYNRKLVIRATIDSVLKQEYQDFEIIVVDDGSTDGTLEYLTETYERKIKLVRISNSERGKARNVGTLKATGEYIYFLDSDDILYQNHLEEALKFIQTHKRPEWIFQEYELLNKVTNRKSQVHYDKTQPKKYLVSRGNFLSCHGVFLRRDIALRHPFDENREMAGSEDYALWLELCPRYPLHINYKVTSALVQHKARSVFNFDADKLIRRKKLMLKKISSDSAFNRHYADLIPLLEANTYSYLALHLAMIDSKGEAAKYFLRSLKKNPSSIFTKRTSAILKHLIR